MFRAPLALVLLSPLARPAAAAPQEPVMGDGQVLPVLELLADDTVVDRSCRVRIAPGTVIADRGHPGVLRIVASGVTVVFEEGSVLQGASEGAAQDLLEGVGVLVDGADDVVVRGLHAEGFRCALLAQEADGLLVEDCSFARNYAQRLGSTPAAEDAADWLWPHRNDAAEWRTNYGAAVCVEQSESVVLRRIRVRAQQNGLLLDRVSGARIYDNDCSFLSGWGLAMWRSSDNLVSRNAFDFCIRGYSHGVYNRGQDSAGILAFEQCSGNVFLENSVTHGGDGFFGFAGREALGEGEVPAGFEHRRVGCNDNLFAGNDFSYAAAHGLELTFSFGTRVVGNRFAGNAICGIWGGYSQDLLVADNSFVGNGDAGYGLERGGLNVDHPRGLYVVGNDFRGDACGVHLWCFPSSHEETPWGLANPPAAGEARDPRSGAPSLQLRDNRFTQVSVPVHLRGAVAAELRGNRFAAAGAAGWSEGAPADGRQAVRLEAGARVLPQRAAASDAMPVAERPGALGETRPVGARAHLRGREHIAMTEWGPWDHETPLLRQVETGAGADAYRVLPAGSRFEARLEGAGVRLGTEPDAGGDLLRVEATEAGARPYRLHAVVDGAVQVADGMLLDAAWEGRVFATAFDPREDAEAWIAARDAAWQVGSDAWNFRAPTLDLRYGMGGLPEALLADAAAAPPRDRFGTVARCRVLLPTGRWRLTTESDDGIRVSVDGAVVLEDWTWHAPKRADAEFALEEAREVEILVEHFELDGYALLSVGLEPVGPVAPAPGG